MAGRFQPISDPLVGSIDDALLADLVRLFDNEWWSTGRSPEEVRAIIDHSQVCVGCIDTQTGRLASFARVLTDYATFAVVLDVIVAPEHRGHGLGARLLDDILQHPRLQGLRGIGLQCEEELKPFYERWGFTDAPGRSIQLKRVFDRERGELPSSAARVTAT